MRLFTSLVIAFGLVGVAPHPAKAAEYCGYASHYGVGDGYGGRTTASGEVMDPYAMTAASLDFPLKSKVRVTDQQTGKSVIVRINDRGPYYGGRVLDLSYGAFSQIRNPSRGETYVCLSRVN